MPKILLVALSTLSNCKLEILPRVDGIRGQLLPGLQTYGSLAQLQPHSSLLYRLGIMLESKDEQTLRQLGQLLASCRKLNSLAIYAYGKLDVLTGTFTRLTTAHWLNVWTNELPRLTKLELYNVCVCLESSWRDWFDLIQWVHLREAHFSCASFVINGSSALSHIRSLSLCLDLKSQDWGAYCPVSHFVDTIRPAFRAFDHLQELRLRNATKVLDADLLVHLGKTLERLDIREECSWDPVTQSYNATYLSMELLALMGSSCPYLRDLVLDAPNSGNAVRLSPFF